MFDDPTAELKIKREPLLPSAWDPELTQYVHDNVPLENPQTMSKFVKFLTDRDFNTRDEVVQTVKEFLMTEEILKTYGAS